MSILAEEIHRVESPATSALELPTISVIMVTYNGYRYLEEGLESLLAGGGPGYELVVVDNASTDGSAAYLASHYPQAKLIHNEKNHGFAAACNQGADQASGEVLVFLNQDTRVEPGWLEGLLASLHQDRGTGLVTGKVLLMSQPERIHLCGQEVHYSGLVFGRGYLAPAETMPESSRINAVSGACFAIRRDIWETLGGFDENFYMYYEETDLCWRAQLAGYQTLYTPQAVVQHAYTPTRLSTRALYYSFRNRYLTLFKNWRWSTLLILAPGLVLAELAEWALAIKRGRQGLGAKFRANLWVISHPGLIYKLHQTSQLQRQAPDAEILATRSWQIKPVLMTGGSLGGALTGLANRLFKMHYHFCLWACEKLGL